MSVKSTSSSLTIRPTSPHTSGDAQRGGGAPINDECTGAVNQNLAIGSSVTFTGDNTGATDNGEGLETPAVWEMFTITECADLQLSYCGTTPPFQNGFTGLYQGCPYTSSITAANFDDTTCPDGNFTLFYIGVPAGTYYYPVMLDLDPASPAEGPYTITVSASACAAAPVNDGCASSPVALATGSSVNFTGTTAGATNTGDFVPGSDLDGESATVW
ncbi:MAG: hypothetical protein ABIY71_13185, partial [Flavobacteriales bacterium]